ncbi:TIR domain-containing protein [Allomesorhizobium camelthorni]|uniref:TIR domain-containing protein n=1 Tax=Allomesorhizobium camelthorni TaxID=475069 RepID=A0A6G4WK23_9HYPH|nr:TIR domain-containing protein [Mesorhizobium camelthorni]NGO54576.1 TIR domain-containing protein [Mesorhizobium camelthorni]
MAYRTFFSFHYQRDIWRVNIVRNSNIIDGAAAAGWHDASLWEEVKRQGDAAIKRLIDKGLERTSVTVVCIGAQTASRKYVGYEIEQSAARGNALLGVRIHHLRDQYGNSDTAGAIPALLTSFRAPVINFTTADDLGRQIERMVTGRG